MLHNLNMEIDMRVNRETQRLLAREADRPQNPAIRLCRKRMPIEGLDPRFGPQICGHFVRCTVLYVSALTITLYCPLRQYLGQGCRRYAYLKTSQRQSTPNRRGANEVVSLVTNIL